jgi:hypothetical protein
VYGVTGFKPANRSIRREANASRARLPPHIAKRTDAQRDALSPLGARLDALHKPAQIGGDLA